MRSLLFILLLPLQLPGQQTLSTPRSFPKIESRADWEFRATEIREQILVSCGLWPLPEKSPLQATVFGKIERDGYSVEKVHLQPYPGFYLGGNLYRPLGKGSGPFPAILNPHGHWENGRMADEAAGSIAARCISFARQGMIAFSYDMVGYNDTSFANADAGLHRRYGTTPADELWGINLMGLQTWNSIRALDFLETLPDADPKRLACTGESGGGTQTFILGAIDKRLAAQIPAVMVSHSMQGGCNCENAPGLRVEYSNMEIAAAAAPRPQLLIAATGDWTKTTLEVEGPAIAGIYKLFNAADRFQSVRFDFGHNYNRTSREAAYNWLGHRFLTDPGSLKEQPYQKEPDADLRVFPDGKLPADALTMEAFIAARKEERKQQWQKLVPVDKAGFNRFRDVMLPAWRQVLQTEWIPEWRERKDFRESPGRGPQNPRLQSTVVIKLCDQPFQVEQKEGMTVVSFRMSGPEDPQDEFSGFFTTYNRTQLQNQVRALVVTLQMYRENPEVNRIVLFGEGRAGMLALSMAPMADAVAVDCRGMDLARDEDLLAPGLFAPGLRTIGTFSGGAMLAAPNPLLLFNTGGKFPTADIEAGYRASGEPGKLAVQEKPLLADEVLKWAAGL
ncbi:alpha/beta hydrolase family protein [Luteolibacter sp. Populi]|uniref:alpha/beta hydrolase family protein n=1 Tax=Luteolibacter sp. Populi TaxID=3230487 RepID=UPI0034652210